MTAPTSPDGSERTRLEKRLARTYNRVDDPWAHVQHYRQVMRYVAEHPDAGSTAVANACDQPRGRVRAWMDGSVPDAVRALDVAAEKDWLDTTWSTAASRGINVFVAWVFSGGSISTETYVPHFALDDQVAENVARQAFHAVDLQYRLDRADEPGRATEAVPETHSSIFGRTLAAWGAPVGTKNPERDLSLPAYLDRAPDDVRLDFARTYVLNRSTARHDRPDLPLHFREERSDGYIADLVSFFAAVTDPEAVTRAGDETVYIRPAAADELFMPPTFGGL